MKALFALAAILFAAGIFVFVKFLFEPAARTVEGDLVEPSTLLPLSFFLCSSAVIALTFGLVFKIKQRADREI
ncbi:hypothetical protein [Limoniibacter endophyticus]|uniref:DUF3955 domain-containing protein n=1 Tax=Limoniibacter endophyticus TaxID=1565040 RepID=A0A8J3GGU1_9HYPH|nr:hypothetical protein [Limoniibacter endophyticus]GHC74886.1 hypothetical protein GCM10010136_24180 [Limoniibacter endophyticus]